MCCELCKENDKYLAELIGQFDALLKYLDVYMDEEVDKHGQKYVVQSRT